MGLDEMCVVDKSGGWWCWKDLGSNVYWEWNPVCIENGTLSVFQYHLVPQCCVWHASSVVRR